MKVLFAGSSLHGSKADLRGLVVRPPARQGDVLVAVRDGAWAIGLIDGEFGQHAAVWHKEILFALDRGVAVFGASSMGALRAAECAAFGMVPIGVIATAYLSGELDDDAAVALLMLPPELGSTPVTEPLVDAEATLTRMVAVGAINRDVFSALSMRARALHFTQRTDEGLFAEVEPGGGPLLARYREIHVSQKLLDAELLVSTLKKYEPDEHAARPSFVLAESPFWHDAFIRARSASG